MAKFGVSLGSTKRLMNLWILSTESDYRGCELLRVLLRTSAFFHFLLPELFLPTLYLRFNKHL